MVSNTNRFHGHGSLKHVYTRGITVRNQKVALKYFPAKRKTFRVAVVVSKKVHKSAVVRNRIRRRLYEVARQNIPHDTPTDIVISAYDDSVATLDSQALQETMLDLFQKAKLSS